MISQMGPNIDEFLIGMNKWALKIGKKGLGSFMKVRNKTPKIMLESLICYNIF